MRIAEIRTALDGKALFSELAGSVPSEFSPANHREQIDISCFHASSFLGEICLRLGEAHAGAVAIEELDAGFFQGDDDPAEGFGAGADGAIKGFHAADGSECHPGFF